MLSNMHRFQGWLRLSGASRSWDDQGADAVTIHRGVERFIAFSTTLRVTAHAPGVA